MPTPYLPGPAPGPEAQHGSGRTVRIARRRAIRINATPFAGCGALWWRLAPPFWNTSCLCAPAARRPPSSLLTRACMNQPPGASALARTHRHTLGRGVAPYACQPDVPVFFALLCFSSPPPLPISVASVALDSSLLRKEHARSQEIARGCQGHFSGGSVRPPSLFCYFAILGGGPGPKAPPSAGDVQDVLGRSLSVVSPHAGALSSPRIHRLSAPGTIDLPESLSTAAVLFPNDVPIPTPPLRYQNAVQAEAGFQGG